MPSTLPAVPPADPDRPTTARSRADDQRLRLLRAIGTVVAEKGYAATTIADVVGEAHVSKRTFYEHFDDKLACFLESYRRGSGRLVRRLRAGARGDGPWPDRLRAALRAYLEVLVDAPAVTRTFTLEIQAAGPEALALRRRMHGATADALREAVDEIRADHPELRPLDATTAAAIVGAMTELVLDAVADGRTAELAGLAVPVGRLLHAVLTAPADPTEPAADQGESTT
ncbi:TetR/AcrR family transcriptional regulator [Patulibacter sp. S7RM1-6]